MLFLMERLGLSGSVLQEVQDIPHTPHTTTARSQTGVPPQPNPLQCCDRRATASSVCQPGRVLYCRIQHQHLSVCGRRLRHCLQQDGDAEPTGPVCRVRELVRLPLQREKVWVNVHGKPGPQNIRHLGGDIIPALTWYKYLGCTTGAFRTRDQDLDSVKEDLLRDTYAILKSPLAEWQKLDVFRRFLFPRLTLIFQVIFPGPTWCRRLDTKLRGVIKQGLKFPQMTCTQYLYLPQASGGLGVPNAEDSPRREGSPGFQVSGGYQRPRVSCSGIATTESDGCKEGQETGPHQVGEHGGVPEHHSCPRGRTYR